MSSARQVRIVVDVHEGRRMPRALSQRGAAVDVVNLPVGDYVVADDAAVERKTVRDLHLAVVSGRLWLQMARLRNTFQWTYVLVEGPRLDDGPLTRGAVRGALLAVMERGIRVIWSEGMDDSADWLISLARRLEDSRRKELMPRHIRNARAAHDPAAAVLAGVPGISTISARALLATFGSVASVAAAGEADLQRVRGIGPRRAESLRRVLNSSARSAEERDPST